MKHIALATTIAALSTNLPATESETIHCFAPKAFFRHHDEGGYKYDTFGVGFQYNLINDYGINVKLSVINNPFDDNVMTEAENSLSFKLPYHDMSKIYPIFSHRMATHNILKNEEKKSFVLKNSFFYGIGMEFLTKSAYTWRAEIHGFHDMYNAIMVRQEEHFWGKTFENPNGIKAKIGISKLWGNKGMIDFESYYAKTIGKCYEEYGCELSFNWGF